MEALKRKRHPGQEGEAEEGFERRARARRDDLAQHLDYVETAKVFDILMAVVRRVKAARFLNQARISQAKTVGGLSERQRAGSLAFNRA